MVELTYSPISVILHCDFAVCSYTLVAPICDVRGGNVFQIHYISQGAINDK